MTCGGLTPYRRLGRRQYMSMGSSGVAALPSNLHLDPHVAYAHLRQSYTCVLGLMHGHTRHQIL